MAKYQLSYVESLILEGDKQKQKDAKYNEMLEMLEWILSGQFIDNSEIEKLIKEAKEF